MYNKIVYLIKLFNKNACAFIIIVFAASFISVSLQFDTQHYETSWNMRYVDTVFRVLAGAAAGGLLTILMLNHTLKTNAFHSYRAIIWRLIELSAAAYVDVLGNYGRGEFINKLFMSEFNPGDGIYCIKEVISLLKEKARELDNAENDKNSDISHVYGLFKYDRSCNLVKDLTNIYYRDAISNTTDKHILGELHHCRNQGLILIGLLEGDFKQSGRLWTLVLFLEINLGLYKILLKQLGKTVVEPEIKVTGEKA